MTEGSLVSAITGTTDVSGHHTCRYGMAPAVEGHLVDAGLTVSGRADDGTPEVVELTDHPFFVATLYHLRAGDPLLTAFAAAVGG